MAPANDSSQAEIWDDSALVNSWNEALEEYKHYHSIHARGERVGDILKQTSEAGTDGMNANAPAASAVNREDDQAAIVMEKEGQVQTTVGNKDLGAPMAQEKQPEQVPGGPSNSTGSPSWKAPALPQHLIGQVHDEGLKNLLMSWYYAGYYTGLYEGQRKAA